MATQRGEVPAAPRKTLLEWIELDDGDTSIFLRPICADQTQALHARIATEPTRDGYGPSEPLPPPAGLSLPPLG